MEQRKKISFGFSLADEKIKLIDLLSEDDDDFLVALPFCHPLKDCFSDYARDHGGFRSSGFENPQEVERIQEKEHDRSSRPSFLRRSLAWDNAFFDSAGVLDPDELSIINKGFRTSEVNLLSGTRDVRKRRSEPDSMRNGDGVSLDWFEIDPLFYNSNCSNEVNVSPDQSGLEQERLKTVQASKKVHKSFLDKMKSNQTCTGKDTNVQSAEKMKNETTLRRKQRIMSSVASGRMKNISTSSNYRNLSAKLGIKMENKSTADTGTSLVVEKKPASRSSPTASIALSSSATPFINMSTGAASSPQASTLLKRKTESRNSKLSSSLSASRIWRRSEMNRGMVSCPRASSTSHWSSESLSSSSPLSSSKATAATCSVRSLTAKDFRPSGLRPPSPRIRFFDENTPPYHEVTRSRKMPRKVISEGTSSGANTYPDCLNSEFLPDPSNNSKNDSACKKLRTPCSEAAVSIKRPKTDHTNTFLRTNKEMCSETERVDYQESEKRNPSRSDNQLGNLSKYFEAIDLNQEKKQIDGRSKHKNNLENKLLDSPMASPKPQQLPPKPLMAAASTLTTRSPLADKTSACNLSETLASPMEPKKENLVLKASSVYTSSEVTNKEIG